MNYSEFMALCLLSGMNAWQHLMINMTREYQQPQCWPIPWVFFNTLRPRQNGCHFAEDILKCIFLNENVWIPIKISLKFVPKDPINNKPALVQIMAWCCPGAKPLSESVMVSLPTHIWVTRPQWVNELNIPVLVAMPWNLHQLWLIFHIWVSCILNIQFICNKIICLAFYTNLATYDKSRYVIC